MKRQHYRLNPHLMSTTCLFRHFLSITLICLLTACGSPYQIKTSSPYVNSVDAKTLSEKMDGFLPALMVEENIPGISISVIDDNKMVLNKAYGLRNTKARTSVNENTIFEFASLSKPVFALAVMKLSDKGIIDLDKPLYEYLKFQAITKDARHKLITARTVLSHSTGLPNWTKGNEVDFSFTPGEQFSYSGLAYYYLQQTLEKLTGKPLQQIVEEEVFLPLKMTHSSFVWNDDFNHNKSAGHSAKGRFSREIRKPKKAVSASSLLSNTKDYAKFLSHILEQYKNGNPIIKKMVSPITQVKNDGDWGQLAWGLGWGIEQTPEGQNIWHWGNNDEFRSLVLANLERGIGLVFVANSASGLQPVSYVIQHTIGGIHPLTRFKYVH